MYIQNETITPDNTTTLFTLANNFTNGTVLIVYNGLFFTGYYEKTPNQIQFDFAPQVGDVVQISYYKAYQPNVLNASHYITPEQMRKFSASATIVAMTDVALVPFIRIGEMMVDNYIGKYVKNYTSENGSSIAGQMLTFPRAVDDKGVDNISDYVGIPLDITQGTFQLVEYLVFKGAETASKVATSDIQSETLGDYSYSKKASKYTSARDEAVATIFGIEAKFIFDKYRNNSARVGEIKIGDSNPNFELLNSRQRFLSQN